MPTATRCECCDLPTESCGRAAEARLALEEGARQANLLRNPPWFTATYAGHCGNCAEHFESGYPIRVSTKRGAYGRPCYIGACCAEEG